MCGFTIIIKRNKKKIKINKSTLKHRGPDNSQYIFKNGINFRHWRLSIVDLTKKSNQPMTSKNYVLLYNGEIYDFKKISKKNFDVECASDTIFLNKFLNKYGNLNFIKNLSGFYSYAYFDKKNNQICFSRDKIGKKFLYYYKSDDNFIISSEEKGITPFIKREINNDSLVEYFFYKNLFYGKTYYKNVKLIPPGSILKFDISGWKLSTNCTWDKYYKKRNIFGKKKINTKELGKIINQTVEQRNVSDVRTQLALSSGLDSNLILKYIINNKKINNFYRSIGIGIEGKNNENQNTKKLIKKTKVKFKALNYNTNNFWKDLKKCVYHNDGPLEHPNSIVFSSITKETQRYGKILITGEGADDMFYGYKHYYLNNLKNTFAFRLFHKKNIINKINKKILNKQKFNELENKLDHKYFFKKAQASYLDCRNLEFKTHLQTLLKRNDKIGMMNSIEVRCPFLDPKILRISFNKKISKRTLYKNFIKNNLLFKINKKKNGFFIPVNNILFKKNHLKTTKYFKIVKNFFKKNRILDLDENLIVHPSIAWSIVNLGIFLEVFKKNNK